MGVIIYPTANLTITGDMPPFYETAIEGINNGWDDQAFKITGQEIELCDDWYEGCDPTDDAVIKPLKELLQYTKNTGLSLQGSVSITSDYSDYDNQIIVVKDGQIEYGNLEIYNATDQDLILELKRRGYKTDSLIKEKEEDLKI